MIRGKRILAFILAAAMMLAEAAPVFAVELQESVGGETSDASGAGSLDAQK